MELHAIRVEEGLSSEERLLDQRAGAYVEPIKEVFTETRVGNLLVDRGLITPSQLREAVENQKKEQTAKEIQELIDTGLVKI